MIKEEEQEHYVEEEDPYSQYDPYSDFQEPDGLEAEDDEYVGTYDDAESYYNYEGDEAGYEY